MTLPTLAELDLTVGQLAALTNPEFERRCAHYLSPSDPEIQELVAMGLIRPTTWRFCYAHSFNGRRQWRRSPAWKSGQFLYARSLECREILKSAYDLPSAPANCKRSGLPTANSPEAR